jgi:hypothetical protein
VLLNSLVDLVSFSGILYSIYPPLFAALLLYSLGGTAASVALGKVGGGGLCDELLLTLLLLLRNLVQPHTNSLDTQTTPPLPKQHHQ